MASHPVILLSPTTHPPSPHTQCKVLEPGSQLGPDAQSGLDKLGVSVANEQLERIAIVQVLPPLHHHGSFTKPSPPSNSEGTCLLVLQVQAKKPAYEVGTSSQLSFANKLTKKGELQLMSSVPPSSTCFLYLPPL